MLNIRTVENNTAPTVIVATLFLLAVAAGYTWGKIIKKGDNITLVYIFKGKSGTTVKEGFACLCQKPISTPDWYGRGNDSACKVITSAKVLTLQDSWIPDSEKSNVPPPAGACCKAKPSIPGVNITVPAGVNCYVPI
jgi:hypothetical protein